ncbi:hypothetical protein DVH24_015661 [Malus domestica]|uniref:DUF1985 domain-containing protein n=1 Tax=Malus domestica TaxID=3750 RepID=A0A498HJ73_MALDO|nr:hypothetical protein DVH24_015661 [Malus domestica]
MRLLKHHSRFKLNYSWYVLVLSGLTETPKSNEQIKWSLVESYAVRIWQPKGFDELDFSRQLLHELLLHRVENQGVKDLEGLTYLIGCELTQFTKQNFCLITKLRCDEPHDIKVEPQRIRLLRVYFLGKLGLVGESSKGRKEKRKGKASKKVTKKIYLERAFKECKNRDYAFKIVLVYFVEAVLIRAKNNVVVILYYLHLLEHMDRFNNFEWGSISFGQLHDNLSFAASRRGRGRVERIMRKKKKLGERRGCNGLDKAAKYFPPTLLLDDGSGCYTKNFVVEDNEEAANPRETIVVYNQKLRGITAVRIREIVLTKVERNKEYWTWGDDMDVVIHENLTPDTNDVDELKLRILHDYAEESGKAVKGGGGIKEDSEGKTCRGE